MEREIAGAAVVQRRDGEGIVRLAVLGKHGDSTWRALAPTAARELAAALLEGADLAEN
jgi:hypothetical protein